LCVAEHTKIIPLSGSSRSFCNKGTPYTFLLQAIL
jgi:hypothetical protein